VAIHRGGAVARDTQQENDDTSHGVRLPSAKSVQVVVTPVYLAGAIRPQSFSLSRRFDPTWTSWLCFAPLPPMGFRPSELFPLNQPPHLSVPVALLPLGQQPPSRAAAPVFLCFDDLETSPSRHPLRLSVRRQGCTGNIIRTDSVSKPPSRCDERLQQPLERDAQTPTKALPGSVKRPDEASSNRREPRLQSLTPAESPFPVRQSLDHPSRPMLSWPSPSPRPTKSAVGLSPSPLALAAWPPLSPSEENDRKRPLGHASGCRSD
jgi:hypothetical protein